MGLEVEVKAYAVDLKEIEAKILGMGAETTWEGEQVDTYYNHPERDFAKTDEALRIRKEKKRNALTYKGPKVDNLSKTREEIQFSIEDPEAAGTMLERLGFSEAGVVKKHINNSPPERIRLVKGLYRFWATYPIDLQSFV